MLLAALDAAFPDSRHTIERLTPVGADEALLYRRFTATPFLGAVTAGARLDFAGTDLLTLPSANCARTTLDHDRVTEAGKQAAAASRKSIRPPLR
ncbi:hypothetical protein JOF53_008540 [Crossiella equi]|uniref:Uncharacterized protein n=1 Tax=Crossiella equi TaxID=130796 RepID=A0ABS5ASY3_9PSEU|nr:hypothetical protein [Crossiella equi]MBP2479668.1 hypothetical protein [Crossiella equi]